MKPSLKVHLMNIDRLLCHTLKKAAMYQCLKQNRQYNLKSLYQQMLKVNQNE